MRVLLISSAFSGLTQHFFTELKDVGYLVTVELYRGDIPNLLKGVRLFKPNLIICPYLTQKKHRLPDHSGPTISLRPSARSVGVHKPEV